MLLILLLAGLITGPNGPPKPALAKAELRGFCANGYPAYWTTTKPADVAIWGSFCVQGDSTTGTIATAAFAGPAVLDLYLVGYPGDDGLALDVENVRTGERLRLLPRANPGQAWTVFHFPLPDRWRGQAIRLIGSDTATVSSGWFAFSDPLTLEQASGLPQTASIKSAAWMLVVWLLHCILLFAPGVAGCVIAARRGLKDTVVLGLLGITTSLLVGYLGFWIWFLLPSLGRIYGIAVPILSMVVIFRSPWAERERDGDLAVARPLIGPALLTAAASLLVLAVGFLYGGMQVPFDTAANRFSHPLPDDNTLPYKVADGLLHRKVPIPLDGVWLSSDRPPLQSGIAVSQAPFLSRPRTFDYQVTSVIVQSYWVFALWVLLNALSLPRRLTALILGVCLFSGFAFLNSFFVWPKLLAAACGLAGSAVPLSPVETGPERHSALAWTLAGALAALAMLSHGGAFFALLGLVVTVLVLLRNKRKTAAFWGAPPRRSTSSFAVWRRASAPFAPGNGSRWRNVSAAIVAATVLYIPWTLYQKLYDPPGDRLLRSHLAGVDFVDKRPFLQVLTRSYEQPLSQTIHNKWENVSAVIACQGYWKAAFEFWRSVLGTSARSKIDATAAARQIRAFKFYNFVSELGVLVCGVAGLTAGLRKKWRSNEWRISTVLWLYVILTLAVWCAVMFGPGTTVIHQGPYLAVLLAHSAALTSLWSVRPWLAWVTGLLQIVENVFVYLTYGSGPVPGAILSIDRMEPGCLIVAILSLAATLLLLSSIAGRKGTSSLVAAFSARTSSISVARAEVS